MKKKFGVALVLALSLILCLSTTALAWEGFEFQEADGATAEWTDETAAVGDYSVRLDWPAPYKDADNNYIVPRASVVITDFTDLTIGDVDSWSYWIYAPKNYAPNLTFYTDTVTDGDSDTTITAWPRNPDNTWTLIDETTIGGYNGIYLVWIEGKASPVFAKSWTDIQEGFDSWREHYDFSDAEILNLLIGKGVMGTNRDLTVFVDDFTINGITYRFEPPPPPPPPPSPKLHVGQGSPWDAFAGQFAVGISANTPAKITAVYWEEGWNGKTLKDDLVEVGICYASAPTTYMLVIPAGTVVEGYYGGRVQQFTLWIVEDKLCFSPPTKFSKAVTLYELEGETWVEILRFDQVDAYGETSLSSVAVTVD